MQLLCIYIEYNRFYKLRF